MKAIPLTDLTLMFARARTKAQRDLALYQATNCSRFDEEQMTELRALLTEARNSRENVHALRPLPNPAQDCPELAPLVECEAPKLPPEILEDVSDWVRGWNRADELRMNRLTAPGPMLFCGPTGTGKTMLTRQLPRALTGRIGLVLDAHRVISSHLGDTGAALAKVFSYCERTSSLLVIEEIDGIAEMRGGGGSGAERENNRITIALMRLIEAATFPLVVTCNRPEILDVALLRRFEVRLDFAPMAEEDRTDLLRAMLGEAPTSELIALPLGEAVARVQQIKRRQFLDRTPV